MSDIQQRADRFVMNTYRRYPMEFVRGSGMHLYDSAGGEYVDFVAGVAVIALGHSHPAVTAAITKAASTLTHTSNLYYTGPMAELAKRLVELMGWEDGRVFFANSGAEANECAIKLTRKWALRKFGPGRYETVAALGSFHGRTLETLAATGQPEKWKSFQPLPPGFRHVAYDDISALEAAIDDKVSSVLLEPVLGEGGVLPPSENYLGQVQRICEARDLAFIADEVQTGLGRTGAWFASQDAGAQPHVITLAKALGNGLPIGACVARGEFAETFEPGDHGTTMGGGPLVTSAALAVLETIEDEGLCDNARKMGEYLVEGLKQVADDRGLVVGVRGKGLLIGVPLRQPMAREVALACLRRGLLVNDVGPSTIRLSPPLIVNQDDCDRALSLFREGLAEVKG